MSQHPVVWRTARTPGSSHVHAYAPPIATGTTRGYNQGPLGRLFATHFESTSAGAAHACAPAGQALPRCSGQGGCRVMELGP